MEKWKFKKLLKTTLLLICIYDLLILIIGLFMLLESELYILLYTILVLFLIGWIPVFFILIIYWLTNLLKNDVKFKGYYREIDDMYPPAMSSYLVDSFIEKNEAVLATILNLSIKNNLKIEKVSNKLKISINESKNEIIYSHEEYIINTLKNNEKINVNNFIDSVILDCEKNELIYKKNDFFTKFFQTIRIIFALIGIFGTGVAVGGESGGIFIIALVFATLAYIGKFAIKTYERTSKGLEFAAKSKKLKNFFRDYTLLKDKDYDHIKLLGEYIPYALALGEAEKIEDLHIEGNNLIKDIVNNINIMEDFIGDY